MRASPPCSWMNEASARRAFNDCEPGVLMSRVDMSTDLASHEATVSLSLPWRPFFTTRPVRE